MGRIRGHRFVAMLPAGDGSISCIPEDRELHASAVARCNAPERPRSRSRFACAGSDGVYRVVQAHAAPLYDEHGNLQEWFGTTTDVTPQYEAQGRDRSAQPAARRWRCRPRRCASLRSNCRDWTLSIEDGSDTRQISETLTYEAALARVHPDDRAALDRYVQASAHEAKTRSANFEFRVAQSRCASNGSRQRAASAQQGGQAGAHHRLADRYHRAQAAGADAARIEPPQGRVPRDARARIAQSARAVANGHRADAEGRAAQGARTRI